MKPRSVILVQALLVLALLLVLAGCGEGGEKGSSQPPAAEAPAPAPPPPAPPPEAPVEEAPTAAGDTATRTFPCIDGNPDAGAAHYATLCASCHGPEGNGEGPAAAGLNPKPALHVDGSYMNPLSNEHVFTVIRDGGAAVGRSPLMAPWSGALKDAQIWDVVAYLRSLAAPPYACPTS